MFRVTDLQATEPDELFTNKPEHVLVAIDPALDSMGFNRVAIAAPTEGEVLAFVLNNWGDDASTGGWYTEHVVHRVEEVTDRATIAAHAYAAVYAGPWGLKASNEDALLGVVNALYPDFPRGADGIYEIRGDEQLDQLATYVYETLECAGMDVDEIVTHLLPRLDAVMAAR